MMQNTYMVQQMILPIRSKNLELYTLRQATQRWLHLIYLKLFLSILCGWSASRFGSINIHYLFPRLLTPPPRLQTLLNLDYCLRPLFHPCFFAISTLFKLTGSEIPKNNPTIEGNLVTGVSLYRVFEKESNEKRCIAHFTVLSVLSISYV